MLQQESMVSVLFRFMLLFKIKKFWILNITDLKIHARVGWEGGLDDEFDDDGFQEIAWKIQNFDNYQDALHLVELLISNELIDIDQITISYEKLQLLTGWKIERFRNSVKTLLEYKVDMLDDGVKTDYFFVHF